MATLKNTTFNDTGHIRLPSGTEGQRPSTPQAGMMRYNNSAGQFEAYAASGEWQAVTLAPNTVAPGQSEYNSPGTYSWVAPTNVTEVQVLAVGGGGGGQNSWANPGGAGAGLGWRNGISVNPGSSYTVQVGYGGGNGQYGNNSYFQSTSTVAGYGGGAANGQRGGPNQNGRGGGYVGEGGGAGGNANDWTGGGGAGG